MLNKYQLCIRSHQTKGHCNPMVKVLSPHFKGEKKRNKIEAWKLSMFSKGKKKKKRSSRGRMVQIQIQHLQPQSFCKTVQIPIL